MRTNRTTRTGSYPLILLSAVLATSSNAGEDERRALTLEDTLKHGVMQTAPKGWPVSGNRPLTSDLSKPLDVLQ